MGSLQNKVALVTGAASGIGREVALCYAAEGAKVVVADINASGAEETVGMIKGNSGEAIAIHADSSKATDNEMLVRKAVDYFGTLHVACNNAGIGGPSAPTGEYPIDGWEKVIGVNLSGIFYAMRYEIPAMLKSGVEQSLIWHPFWDRWRSATHLHMLQQSTAWWG